MTVTSEADHRLDQRDNLVGLPASACSAVLTPKTHCPPIYPSLVRLHGQISRLFRRQVLQCVPYVSHTQAFKFPSAYLSSGTQKRPSYHKWCPPVGPLSYCVDLLPSHRLINVSILGFVTALGDAFSIFRGHRPYQ
jgi:hypothetical protein